MERAQYELMHRLESRMWWYRGMHAMMAQTLARLGAGRGRLLDAGCGTGGLLAALARAGAGGWRAGLEIDPLAAALARDKSGAAIAAGTVNAMPFGGASFAVVVSADVLCHARVEPATALREIHRVLAPAGIVVLNLPAYGWLLSAHDRAVHNVRRFSARGVRRLMAAEGFGGVRVAYWNSLLLPLMIIRRLLPHGGSGKSDVMDYPLPLNTLFGAILALERTLLRAGIRLPFGGSLLVVGRKHG